MRFRSFWLFVLVVFLWGSNWSAMKAGLDFVSPVAFVLQRFVVSVAVLLPFIILLRKRVPRDADTLVKLMVLCLVFVSIIIVQAFGLAHESSGVGAVLTYTQPLFVFCLAVPFLKEKITALKLLGASVGFAGVIVLSFGKIGSFEVGSVLLMLLGAVLWALAVVYYKRFLNGVDPFVTHFLQLAVGVLPLLVWTFSDNGFVFPCNSVYVWILLYSSVGALAFGNVIWLYLLQREEAATLSGSTLIIPAVALVFGWLLLGESLSAEALFGAALTLGGVYLINFKRKQLH